MRIEQLMQKDVGSVTAEQTLNEAAQVLWERDCGSVPVLSEDGARRVVGMLTDREICMAAYTQGKELCEIPVRAVMSTAVQTCRPDDSVEDAEAILRRARVRRLPVVDDAEVAVTLASICAPREACAPQEPEV